MAANIFAEREPQVREERNELQRRTLRVPDYNVSNSTLLDHAIAWLIGFAAGCFIVYTFYMAPVACLIFGVLLGVINIFADKYRRIEKRKQKLRSQFYDMLEAMSVAMRAGNPPVKALKAAREDLRLLYSDNSDICVELDIILARFNNAVPLSQSFADLATRSGLEDIDSFASIYATIEGKSSRADEIVRETQQIISDKMRMEMEIETMMTAAKSEVNIMLFMPLVILLVIGYAGENFMDAIYTTFVGRIVATVGLIIFFICYILAKKFSNIII